MLLGVCQNVSFLFYENHGQIGITIGIDITFTFFVLVLCRAKDHFPLLSDTYLTKTSLF
jgi:hypothetical protein